MSKIIGYARVSTIEQNIDSQLNFLKQMGCTYIFQEKISATSHHRIALQQALKMLSRGDYLIVFKLDRLGRSVKDLLQIVEQIKSKGAHLKTLDGIDTSNAYGIFIFHIFSALAEMELALIRERTRLGIMSAKLNGKKVGRPKGIGKIGESKALLVQQLYQSRQYTIHEICQKVNISRTTFYKYLSLKKVNLIQKKIDS